MRLYNSLMIDPFTVLFIHPSNFSIPSAYPSCIESQFYGTIIAYFSNRSSILHTCKSILISLMTLITQGLIVSKPFNGLFTDTSIYIKILPTTRPPAYFSIHLTIGNSSACFSILLRSFFRSVNRLVTEQFVSISIRLTARPSV